jgi:hypothetical protein
MTFFHVTTRHFDRVRTNIPKNPRKLTENIPQRQKGRKFSLKLDYE